MAWTDSRVFTQAVLNPLTASAWSTTEPTTYGGGGLSADTINVALFGTAVTPDKDAVVGSTGYNTGTWTTGNEVTGTSWAAGGQTLGTKTWAAVTGSVGFDAANVVVANATISAAFGCLVYDATITGGTVNDQGLCFCYFGGSQSIAAGTFTIQWNAAGIFNFTT